MVKKRFKCLTDIRQNLFLYGHIFPIVVYPFPCTLSRAQRYRKIDQKWATNDSVVDSSTSNAFSAMRFSVSSVGLTSTISQQHTLRSLISSAFNCMASSTDRPSGTGVPVPLEIELSILSTSKDIYI